MTAVDPMVRLNPRTDGNFTNDSVPCTECGGMSEVYYFIKPHLLCKSCLSNMIQAINRGILSDINNRRRNRSIHRNQAVRHP